MGYEDDKKWHGLSCGCGGGYRVGHHHGAPCADDPSTDVLVIDEDIKSAAKAGDADEVADLTRIKGKILAGPLTAT
jgi:hypothetical protein